MKKCRAGFAEYVWNQFPCVKCGYVWKTMPPGYNVCVCVCVCRHACVSKYVILWRSDHTSQLVHLSSDYDYILLQNLAKMYQVAWKNKTLFLKINIKINVTKSVYRRFYTVRLINYKINCVLHNSWVSLRSFEQLILSLFLKNNFFASFGIFELSIQFGIHTTSVLMKH
jgi:hypothetical protein